MRMQAWCWLAVGCCLAQTVAAGPLDGQWHGTLNGQPLALQLNKDGSGTLDGEPLNHEAAGGVLILRLQDGTVMVYGYRRQGATLTVQGADLVEPLVLTQGAPGKKAGSAAAPGISPVQLAGTWCLVTTFSANAGGGSSSSECFTLTAQGRYTYGAESSLSAYGGGMYGGTASQSSDSGQWTATRSELTALSDAGARKVYRLELKNHPRNRDPMICLDGDCYVSYYQKSPW